MDRIERDTLMDRYRAGAAAVDDALAGITDAELDRVPPEDDGWTARQIVHHLADSEAMAYTRLRRVVADEEPHDPGLRRAGLGPPAPLRPADRAVDRGHARRARVEPPAPRVASPPDEWSRTGTHSESGAYSVEEWVRIYASHPHDHADQIRRARGT